MILSLLVYRMTKLGHKLFRLAGIFYSLLFSVTISFVTVILVNVLVATVALVWKLLKLERRIFAELSSLMLRTWFSIFIGHLEHFGGLTVVLTGDAFFAKESALVVCNHRSWADTIVLYSIARQVQMHGDLKFLAKRSLLLFPLYGFAGYILDVVIFIKRQSTSAGRRMGNLFSSLSDPHRGTLSYWLVNYLEGTRFTDAKRRGSNAFAKQRGLKPLQHILQPRTKGFVSTVHALRGNAEAVYDVTIGYQESETKIVQPTFISMWLTPTITNRVVHVHQRRIPLSQLPEDDEQLKDWIYTLYEQKDELLRTFKETGAFAGRPMRWNRMTLGFWLHCQFVIYGTTILVLYLAYLIYQNFR